MRNYIAPLALLLGLSIVTPACKEDARGINLFSLEDDRMLGRQLQQEIESNPQEYPVLDPVQYPEAYGYLLDIRDRILAGGQVDLADEFLWETYIIEDDNTLNAFCAPGGYIYVYTGLIKYLDTEDELAGVMGHEIAHADRRHSTEQLTKAYGLATLVELALGDNQGLLSDAAQQLIALSFSRSDEREADDYSVEYLCPTVYNASGAAGFFEKIEAEGGASVPQFLSTHPNPDNRVQEIHARETELGCDGSEVFDARYAAFKASLP